MRIGITLFNPVSAALTILLWGSVAHAQLPNPPGNVVATNGTSTDSVTVTWNSPIGGGDVDNYEIYRSTNNFFCPGTAIATVNSTDLSYVDNSVVPAVTYYYSVKATNTDGDSNCSNTDIGYADSLPASFAPENLAATNDLTDKITVSWDLPTGGQPIDHFEIYRSTIQSFCPDPAIAEVDFPTQSYDDTDADAGQVYYYSIISVGPTGAQSACNTLAEGFRVEPPPPLPPQNVSATDGDFEDKIRVTWDPPGSGEPVTSYTLYRSLSPVSLCDELLITGLGTGTLEYDDFAVTPGVLYYYSIEATGPSGTSICSNIDPGFARIGEPENISATDGDFEDKVVVSWDPPVLGGDITGYNLYRDTAATLCNTLLQPNLGPTIIAFDDTTVTPGVIYNYSIETISPTGNSVCTVLDPGFARIGRPNTVSATDGTFEDRIVVTWNPPVTGGPITGYNLYRDLTPTSCTNLRASNLVTAPTAFTDFSVTQGTIYYYSVETISATGVSICSNVDPGFAATPPECRDGVDNDADGKIDFAGGDPGCDNPDDDDEEDVPVCRDGLDNDGDGIIDFAGGDPGCDSPDDDDEEDTRQCRDGIDNDGDGIIDFAGGDPGCDDPDDDNEEDRPECSDGIDNDGDGIVDFADGDPGCDSPDDDDENDDTVCDNGLDDDGDGLIDFKADGTGDPGCTSPEDDSEEDNNEPLKSPAFAKFNTFLGQWNFAELINQGPKAKDVQLTIFNLRGEEMITREFVIPADSQIDVDVNGLIQLACDVLNSGCDGFEDLSETQNADNGLGRPDGIVDTYGLVRFVFDDTDPAEGRVLGRMSFYRPDNGGESFSFAFAREFRNPSTGTTFATANTFDPQGLGNIVPNWAEIINFDDVAQIFTLNIYSQDGLLLKTDTFTLQPLGEVDLHAGHEFVDASGRVVESVFLAEVIPADPEAPYFLSVSRYNSNSQPGGDPSSYNFAFTVEGHSGSAETLYAPIGNVIEGVAGIKSGTVLTNWVEVVNTVKRSVTVIIRFRSASGVVISEQSQTLAPYSQFHFNAGGVLPGNSTGSIEILCDGPIVAQSLSYVHGSNNQLVSGFFSPARTRGRDSQAGSINTFLGMQDVFVSYATTASQVNANFEITSFRGGLFTGALALNAGGSSALQISNNATLNFPADTYGALLFTTEEAGQAQAEVRRVRVDADGEVDFVVPTRVQ